MKKLEVWTSYRYSSKGEGAGELAVSSSATNRICTQAPVSTSKILPAVHYVFYPTGKVSGLREELEVGWLRDYGCDISTR